MTTRLAGPICFQSMHGALDGIAALRDAGFEAEIDYGIVETASNVAWGAVWIDVDDSQIDAQRGKLWDQIDALIYPHYGLCDAFNVGSEKTVWRDESGELGDPPVCWW
jgi:hypothetical protein